MTKPQVTITLGHSGQKVVKESWRESDGGRANASVASGSKRSMAESFGSSFDHRFSNNKRTRGDVRTPSFGYNSHVNDSRLGPRDLRLKLTRKRMSKRIELENEKRKKMELHQKVSKTFQSLESPNHNFLRSMRSSRGAAETSQMGSVRSSYASWNLNGARTRSPERIPKFSGGISTPRCAIVQRSQVPSARSIDASRTERFLMRDPVDSCRPKVPMLTTSRMDSGKLVTSLAPATGGISRSTYHDNQPQPLTVSSLLHSLGLGKYSINFQAEEIDMVALKQMGDGDLKELGIPMGPRKKIILALEARTKRHPAAAQAHRIMSL